MKFRKPRDKKIGEDGYLAKWGNMGLAGIVNLTAAEALELADWLVRFAKWRKGQSDAV